MTHLLRTAAITALLTSATAAGTASAHTSVYTSESKTAAGSPPVLTSATDYLVSNHGFNKVLRETNGVTDRGTLNYKVLPSAWRATQTKATLLATATGAQPHATCLDVPALQAEANILAWQESDPFYNYVPFQATAAGLGDEGEVSAWTKVVKDATGVDLATTPDAKAACANLGGSYKDADTLVTAGSALAAGDIALVADPLKTQIDTYKTQLTAATTRADQAAANLKAASSQLTVKVVGNASLAALSADGVKAQVTGSPNVLIDVTVTVTKKLQTAKRLPTRTLATSTVRLDSAGNGTVTLKTSTKSAKALKAAGPGLAISVTARVAVSNTTQTTLGA